MTFIEYYIGYQLGVHYGLQINNSIAHSFQPNPLYKEMFGILTKYKISIEELLEGSVTNIYKRIIGECGPHTEILNVTNCIEKYSPLI